MTTVVSALSFMLPIVRNVRLQASKLSISFPPYLHLIICLSLCSSYAHTNTHPHTPCNKFLEIEVGIIYAGCEPWQLSCGRCQWWRSWTDSILARKVAACKAEVDVDLGERKVFDVEAVCLWFHKTLSYCKKNRYRIRISILHFWFLVGNSS